MSLLEDSFEFVRYIIGSPGGRPLIEKKSRLIAAVVHNQVEILRELFDSPEWYNVRDRDGYTLLQIAIRRENREAFNYMLSIPDFPIDYVNKNEQTALVVALDEYNTDDIWMDEYFAYELVKKGACIDVVCRDKNTPLRRALDRSYNRVAILLIEKGVDVNVVDYLGYPPLYTALRRTDDSIDLVCALLMYGAEPSMKIFQCSILLPAPFTVQEILFLYIFDRTRAMRINLALVLILAERRSRFFQEIINHPNLRIRSDPTEKASYYRNLCSMGLDYLQIVINRIGPYLSAAFEGVVYEDIRLILEYERRICLENLNALIGSDLKWKIISVISTVNSGNLFEILMNRIRNEATITRIYCFLLSYGLNISESDLQLVYWRFGYCELFKILLYMDIKASAGMIRYIRCIMAVFIYDLMMNLESFLADRTLHYFCSMEELFSHFAHPRLTAIYLELHGGGVPNRNNPDFPLLLELARNAFRQYFINRLQIETSCQFYTELNRLPIPVPHKKMITYETTLY